MVWVFALSVSEEEAGMISGNKKRRMKTEIHCKLMYHKEIFIARD
jgi:hypothetical protein